MKTSTNADKVLTYLKVILKDRHDSLKRDLVFGQNIRVINQSIYECEFVLKTIKNLERGVKKLSKKRKEVSR